MNVRLYIIIVLNLFIIINANPQNIGLNAKNEINEENENKDFDEEVQPFFEASLKNSTPEILSDAQRLDRLARGAEYVDRFDWMDRGKSQLINAEDIKDFARDPSLAMITTYGQDRVREENIKRNLFETAHDNLYLEKNVEPRQNGTNESPLLQIMRKLGFVQKLIFKK